MSKYQELMVIILSTAICFWVQLSYYKLADIMKELKKIADALKENKPE